jgi:cell division transport system permease protein
MRRKLTTFGRIIRTGMVNFVRGAWLAIAAMAIMVVTLTIILFSVVANATFGNTIDQITERINISVYLKDEVTAVQAKKLTADIKKLPNTASVTYLTKQQALEEYMKQNAGNEQLLSAINETDNPLPATILIKPKDLNRLGEIRTFLDKPEVKALQSDPVSDSGERREVINKITHATNTLSRAGVIAVAVFATVSVLIIFNTIQMAIFNRRDELQIMRLLGASTWYIRGPFVVEAIIYGILSAIASVLIINAIFVTASDSLVASSFNLFDIGFAQQFLESHYWALLTLQLMLGIFIGAASSVIATRRYLKFKTPKK